MIDPLNGQPLVEGSPEHAAFVARITPELNAMNISVNDYLSGGVGATIMNATSSYSSAFAINNTSGGGQEWARSVGGLEGFLKPAGTTVNTSTSEGATAVTAPTVQTPANVGTNPVAVAEMPYRVDSNSMLGWAIIAAGVFIAYKVLNNG